VPLGGEFPSNEGVKEGYLPKNVILLLLARIGVMRRRVVAASHVIVL